MSSIMQASMSDQLLWIETLLKGSIGLIMIFLPITASRLAGFPHGNTTFWPRLLPGWVLTGCALIWRVASQPSIIGKLISIKIKSGSSCSASATP